MCELKVTNQHIVKIKNKMVATEMDFKQENILGFGFCKIVKSKCVPCIEKWNNLLPTRIGEFKMLSLSSFCNCTIGGKIEIVNSGQSGFVTTEN